MPVNCDNHGVIRKRAATLKSVRRGVAPPPISSHLSSLLLLFSFSLLSLSLKNIFHLSNYISITCDPLDGAFLFIYRIFAA